MTRFGLTIRKKLAALLQVINIYSPKNTFDLIYLSNYATINVIDPLARSMVSARPSCWTARLLLRIWLTPTG